ncbi:hypothetical protein [Methylobacterium nigriterrae]
MTTPEKAKHPNPEKIVATLRQAGVLISQQEQLILFQGERPTDRRI